ncbi:MAG TPA: signal peptidase II [Cyclobacteriaceae bacterium]|nr:signal peptidase II [Cyclobacteriaceae bacterium]
MTRLLFAKRIIRQSLIVLVLTANIGCDQVSKHVVRQRMDYFEKIYLIDHHFTITKVENTGAFLSLGNGMEPQVKMWLLTILPLIILAGAVAFVFARKDLSIITLMGLCFFIGGGAGNVFDRVLFGSVTDFLHIDFGLFQTGVFNMADVSIMVGTGLLLWGKVDSKVADSTK